MSSSELVKSGDVLNDIVDSTRDESSIIEEQQHLKTQCDVDNIVYDPSHPCNQFILRQEIIERGQLESELDTNDLYPTMNDPNFSLKIARKHEFHDTMYDGAIRDVKTHAAELENMEFELSSHQLFVKNFLSSHTPYNSLLLYHGLGTGKTCSAIGICEEYRDYIRQTGGSKKILIVASPNVQDNFRLQLFNSSSMTNINGEWVITSCIGNKLIQEINPTKTPNVSKERTILQINRIINESYEFMGYREFANYIEKRGDIGLRTDEDKNSPKNIARRKRNLKEEFDGRLLCIDEVHNIRNADDSDNKMVANQLVFLVKSTRRMKLVLLSGTPMFNSYKEIIWLINLMNMNDGRGLIKVGDVFNANGEFLPKTNTTDGGRDVLARKLTGYVSFVRGENPYTFPFRMYPGTFAPDQTFQMYPHQTKSLMGGKVVPNEVTTITDTNIYLVKVGEYQEEIYNKLTSDILTDTKTQDAVTEPTEDDDEGGVGRLGYTQLQDPIQCLNMTFPMNNITGNVSETTNIQDMLEEGRVSLKDSIGTKGLKSTMDYIDDRTDVNFMKGEFSYKPWVQNSIHKDFFSIDKIGNYSGKIKQICDSVKQSTGVVLIYSQYLDGGLIPIALALESMGITRHGSNDKSLFKTPPTNALRTGPKKLPAKYIMITGDKRISPGNAIEVAEVTKDKNVYGDYVKVVLISMAGSEGVDLKFIRQAHILEPWFNRSRIEQIEGRAVRHNSHKLLPFEERNVQVFLYGSSVRDETLETVDMYVYRTAEFKAIQIGKITRLLKELSVDCFLNHSQSNFSVDNMNQTVRQVLSSGQVIEDFKVGDKPNTMLTDFMEDGNYKCYSQTEANDIITDNLNNSTYGERFIMMNTDKIIQKIRDLFKEKHFYKKSELISKLMYAREYPISQVYSALTILIDTETEYITDIYGRSGRLVNIGEYYLFQPIELTNNRITLFERSIPLMYKTPKLTIKMNINDGIDDTLLRSAAHEDDRPIDMDISLGEKDVANKMSTAYSGKIASSHANIESVDAIISDINDIHTRIQDGREIDNGIARGNPDIYKYVGTAITRMLKQNIISEDEADKFLMEYLLDTLTFGNKIILLHYVFSKEMSDPNKIMKEQIKSWFISQQIETTGDFKLTALLFYDTKSKKKGEEEKIYIRKSIPPTAAGGGQSEVYSWDLAESEDIKDVKQHLDENHSITTEDISNLFGFNGDDLKNDNIIFKLKDAQNKRSKGHRCSEMKKDSKVDILLKLLPSDVVEKLKYINITTKKKDKLEVSYHVMQEVCIFIEFVLRHYNDINKDNKRWFFSYNEYNRFHEILRV